MLYCRDIRTHLFASDRTELTHSLCVSILMSTFITKVPEFLLSLQPYSHIRLMDSLCVLILALSTMWNMYHSVLCLMILQEQQNSKSIPNMIWTQSEQGCSAYQRMPQILHNWDIIKMRTICGRSPDYVCSVNVLSPLSIRGTCPFHPQFLLKMSIYCILLITMGIILLMTITEFQCM